MSRRELANAIRALSMDAVQKANSGHPGAPMGDGLILPKCCGTIFSSTIRRTLTGWTATVSSCPTATRRCCSTVCCT
ncbi:transketolase [Klebsiella pneumoniae]|uniref:Transketolase n=1 Tax=Klebsiella pneumoniae TaxID=573 RepID=A0A2X3H839_KLEPN|nr:transketolase [Klebsiella pneumoniae]